MRDHYQGKLTAERFNNTKKTLYFFNKNGYLYLFPDNNVNESYFTSKIVWRFKDTKDNTAGLGYTWDIDNENIGCGLAFLPYYRGKSAYDACKDWISDNEMLYHNIQTSCYKFNKLSYYFCKQLGFKDIGESKNYYHLRLNKL